MHPSWHRHVRLWCVGPWHPLKDFYYSRMGVLWDAQGILWTEWRSGADNHTLDGSSPWKTLQLWWFSATTSTIPDLVRCCIWGWGWRGRLPEWRPWFRWSYGSWYRESWSWFRHKWRPWFRWSYGSWYRESWSWFRHRGTMRAICDSNSSPLLTEKTAWNLISNSCKLVSRFLVCVHFEQARCNCACFSVSADISSVCVCVSCRVGVRARLRWKRTLCLEQWSWETKVLSARSGTCRVLSLNHVKLALLNWL